MNGTKLKAFSIPLPPLAEQMTALELVEKALGSTHRTLQVTDYATAEIERLNQSVLAKAFRGELVPRAVSKKGP